MTISLKTIMENLPPEPRAIVEKRSVELMAEEMTLQDLRKARRFTQIPDDISDNFAAIFGRTEGRSFAFFDGGDNGNRAIVLGDGDGFAWLYGLDGFGKVGKGDRCHGVGGVRV